MDNENEGAEVGRSSLLSPYFDLNDSIEVAQVIFNKGGGSCTNEQLVVWLGYKTVTSGAYITRVSAARLKYFGLVGYKSGKYTLTERGRRIVAPVLSGDVDAAKAEAFLGVPLFKKVYDEFRGKQLPSEDGLKNLFVNYGILKDRVRLAVKVFLNSAEQAGFFRTSGDRSRLIQPAVTADTSDELSLDNNPVNPTLTSVVKQESNCATSPHSIGHEINPTLLGLLQKLPAEGIQWSQVEKTRFLAAFTSNIEFLYPAKDEGSN